ncbi:CBS domain-containing protein [Beggiatoa alba]|nr:CBS domain-containing protein [Beggiatoa alba]
MKDVLLKDVEFDGYVSVTADCHLQDAIKVMSEKKSSYLLIVNDGKPEGILTERDMVSFLLESFEGVSWKDMPVDHIMVSPVTAVGSDITILEAITIKRGSNIRHIPVVDTDGRVIGVLTQDQIVGMLYEYCLENGIW